MGKETIDTLCDTLDAWARKVRLETERHLYRLTDPQYRDHAEHYKDSEARFRAEWLVMTIQNEFNARYFRKIDPKVDVWPSITDARQCFLNGLVNSDHGGNCVSLPVLYVAVGRRLGYPVQLVGSREHVFCRWEGLEHENEKWRQRFNFDGAGEGFSIDDDTFYMKWPKPSTAAQVKLYDWLKTWTPRQELACFLLNRGHILRENERLDEAVLAYSQARRADPASRNALIFLTEAVKEVWAVEDAEHPRVVRVGQPQPAGRAPRSPQQWWETPHGRAAHWRHIQAINAQNQRLMQQRSPVVPQVLTDIGGGVSPQPTYP